MYVICISFVKLIPKCLLFWCYCKCFKIFFCLFSARVWKSNWFLYIDIIFSLYSLANTNSLWILLDYVHTQLWHLQIMNSVSLFQLFYAFKIFSCYIPLLRTSSIMLNRSSDDSYACHASHFQDKDLYNSPIVYDVFYKFLVDVFIWWNTFFPSLHH